MFKFLFAVIAICAYCVYQSAYSDHPTEQGLKTRAGIESVISAYKKNGLSNLIPGKTKPQGS